VDVNLETTAVLDHQHSRVIECLPEACDDLLVFLQHAHRQIVETVSPVYTLDERQPVSRTLAKGRGSCSQRLACLEAFARARGIGTRVRSLWIRGRFWSRRFPLARCFIPRKILLPWPQFNLEEGWVGVEDLFGSMEEWGRRSPIPFNNDGETLFEALENTVIDFHGRSKDCGIACLDNVDLSSHLLEEGGLFNSRDELFNSYGILGETLRGRIFELIYGGRKIA
jgi:hypothetical protein